MIFAWKQRKENRRGIRKIEISQRNFEMDLRTPTHFLCPISLDLMKDPVTVSTGISYDRESIEKWILSGNQTCPVTNQILTNFDPIPNHSIRRMIQDWCVENKCYGIERIPTPRVPVSSQEVIDISSRIRASSGQRETKECQELVNRIRNLARESERNKNRIKENGIGYVFADSFESFAGKTGEDCVELLKSLLSEITWMFPLGSEGQSKIGSQKSLRWMVWFLNGEDLSAKQHAVTVLKELLCSNSLAQNYPNILSEIENVPEALFKIIKVPICPNATKAALMVMYHMLSLSSYITKENVISRFLDMGLVPLILEMLVDAEKKVSEMALGVLDCVCDWKEGREMACKNALTMPLIVKKMLRISDLRTEVSVSILWKLCKGEDENCVIDAMEMGAFQKLLVILQVGCGGKTKEKTTELLKLMNVFRERVDCFDGSTGFKYVM